MVEHIYLFMDLFGKYAKTLHVTVHLDLLSSLRPNICVEPMSMHENDTIRRIVLGYCQDVQAIDLD